MSPWAGWASSGAGPLGGEKRQMRALVAEEECWVVDPAGPGCARGGGRPPLHGPCPQAPLARH